MPRPRSIRLGPRDRSLSLPCRVPALTSLSWTVVGVFLALTFAIGLFFARRASKSTEEYFLSGRTLPWWIVGTSMVITTFGHPIQP